MRSSERGLSSLDEKKEAVGSFKIGNDIGWIFGGAGEALGNGSAGERSSAEVAGGVRRSFGRSRDGATR